LSTEKTIPPPGYDIKNKTQNRSNDIFFKKNKQASFIRSGVCSPAPWGGLEWVATTKKL
jgi:hypothetical protein